MGVTRSKRTNILSLSKAHEDFCYAYVNITDFDLDKALQSAGLDVNKTVKQSIMKDADIKARVAELVEERNQNTSIDRAFVIDKLKTVIRNTANSDNLYSPHLKAIELLGKHLGMFNEKQAAQETVDPAAVAKELFEKRKALLFKTKGGEESGPIQKTISQ
jgi:hypothetical protein